jgi:hypothetical protein
MIPFAGLIARLVPRNLLNLQPLHSHSPLLLRYQETSGGSFHCSWYAPFCRSLIDISSCSND